MPSTDSSSEAVIHTVPLQCQPQRQKETASKLNPGPTQGNTQFQGLGAQLQQLQQEKEEALVQVQELTNQ